MEIVVLAHNIRSVWNVGSIFRTSEGFGVNKLFLSGYTPSPDKGLPHVRQKLKEQLHKTALGAEELVPNEYVDDIFELIARLKEDGFIVVGLEQDEGSVLLNDFVSSRAQRGDPVNEQLSPGLLSYARKDKIALLIGEEVNGIEPELLKICDQIVEIPMFGKKESFNVSIATGIALYELTKNNAQVEGEG